MSPLRVDSCESDRGKCGCLAAMQGDESKTLKEPVQRKAIRHTKNKTTALPRRLFII